MTIFRYWKDGDPDHIEARARRPSDVSFAVCDPGSQGVLLVWLAGQFPGTPARSCSIDGLGSGHHFAARACRMAGIELLILEDQFLGKNPNSMKKTVFGAGMLLGHVMNACPMTLKEVVVVPPSSWQAKMPRDEGPRKGRGKRGALANAEAMAPRWWKGYGCTKEDKQAAADALGMASWLEGLRS